MKNTERVTKIINLIKSKDYGSIISHQELSKILDLDPSDTKYRRAISIANIELTSSKKRIENIYNVGYKIITPEEYIDSSRNKLSSGFRKLKESKIIIDNTPYSKLSKEKQKSTRQYSERLNGFLLAADKKRKTLFEDNTMLTKKERIVVKI